MTPSTPATCKFCGTLALPNDEQNCSSLDEAYRQTPTRPYGCPWFDKDARKANPAPIPSTPAPTDAGALADGGFEAARVALCERLVVHSDAADDTALRHDLLEAEAALTILADDIAALRNSAPQETRGDEPVAWQPAFDAAIHLINRYRKVATDIQFEQVLDAENDFGIALDAISDSTLAASQQSPRLERDEMLRGLAEFFSESVHHVWSNDEIADCLTGMIDQTVAPSTSRCEVGK